MWFWAGLVLRVTAMWHESSLQNTWHEVEINEWGEWWWKKVEFWKSSMIWDVFLDFIEAYFTINHRSDCQRFGQGTRIFIIRYRRYGFVRSTANSYLIFNENEWMIIKYHASMASSLPPNLITPWFDKLILRRRKKTVVKKKISMNNRIELAYVLPASSSLLDRNLNMNKKCKSHFISKYYKIKPSGYINWILMLSDKNLWAATSISDLREPRIRSIRFQLSRSTRPWVFGCGFQRVRSTAENRKEEKSDFWLSPCRRVASCIATPLLCVNKQHNKTVISRHVCPHENLTQPKPPFFLCIILSTTNYILCVLNIK